MRNSQKGKDMSSEDIREIDESELTSEEMLALHLTELIEAYEKDENNGDDTAFHLEVFTVDGRRHCLPYLEHSHGGVVLMDDSRVPPRPRIIAMRHIVEMNIDPECTTIVNALAFAGGTVQ